MRIRSPKSETRPLCRIRGWFITCEETAKLLAAARDHHWRSILSLSRQGGLRCPSEVLSLRWQDIDWEAGRIVVQSPKTEQHPGKETRTIPLFARPRPILAEAFDRAPERAVWVVDERFHKRSMGPKGRRNCNLRTTFEKIVRRAGPTGGPRLFHNLRASCETERTQSHPLPAVIARLGRSADVALKHYRQVTEGDFEKAIGGPSGALHSPVQQLHEAAGEVSRHEPADAEISPELQGSATSCVGAQNAKSDGEGFEPPEDLRPQQFSRLPP
jgi:Phage integrase family